MKKKALFAITALAMLLLPGCLADTYDLTEGEQDIIAEFAAGVLLRNDENYVEALITPTPVPTSVPTLSPTPTADPNEGHGNAGGTGNGKNDEIKSNASLSEVFGLAGLKVEYEGYVVLNSITANENYVIKPDTGKLLVEVDFILTNTAGIDQKINFGNLEMNYQLDCNEKKFVQPKITPFDLLYLEEEIPAGGSVECYLFFEIGEDADMEDSNLIVSRGDYTSIIPLN